MKDLTFKKFREINSSRANKWHNGDLNDWSLSDWAVAMAGEAGEACDVVKKINRVRDGLVGTRRSKETLVLDLGEELADVLIYLDTLANRAGIDLEQALIYKFNKVSDEFGFEEKL